MSYLLALYTAVFYLSIVICLAQLAHWVYLKKILRSEAINTLKVFSVVFTIVLVFGGSYGVFFTIMIFSMSVIDSISLGETTGPLIPFVGWTMNIIPVAALIILSVHIIKWVKNRRGKSRAEA